MFALFYFGSGRQAHAFEYGGNLFSALGAQSSTDQSAAFAPLLRRESIPGSLHHCSRIRTFSTKIDLLANLKLGVGASAKTPILPFQPGAYLGAKFRRAWTWPSCPAITAYRHVVTAQSIVGTEACNVLSFQPLQNFSVAYAGNQHAELEGIKSVLPYGIVKMGFRASVCQAPMLRPAPLGMTVSFPFPNVNLPVSNICSQINQHGQDIIYAL